MSREKYKHPTVIFHRKFVDHLFLFPLYIFRTCEKVFFSAHNELIYRCELIKLLFLIASQLAQTKKCTSSSCRKKKKKNKTPILVFKTKAGKNAS